MKSAMGVRFVSLCASKRAIRSCSRTGWRVKLVYSPMNQGVRIQRNTCKLYGFVNAESGGQGHDGATSPKFDNIPGLERMFSRCDLETPNLARRSSQIRRSSSLIGRTVLMRYFGESVEIRITGQWRHIPIAYSRLSTTRSLLSAKDLEISLLTVCVFGKCFGHDVA
jgi:hypothetical protein